MFLHGFKQRALRLGRGPIDLVDQYHLRKKRAAMEHETLLAPVEDGIPQNVGRQQIARKLNALKCEGKGARQRLGEHCLAHARDVFN